MTRCLECGGGTELMATGVRECVRCGFVWVAAEEGTFYFKGGSEALREAPKGALMVFWTARDGTRG